MSIKQYIVEGIKDVPIVGVGAIKIFGIPASDWVFILGALYALGRLGWFVVECYWKWKDRQDGKYTSE